MKILHTSDWHLGKTLEGYSRLEEQKLFLDDLIEIVEERDIDLLLIAGDVYDTANPPAAAERMFYETIGRIANHGQRGVLVIAGNHDNPERLEAAGSLACIHGVILLGNPGSQAVIGQYGNVEIVESEPGYIKIRVRGEEAVIITLPYPSEKRLNEIIAKTSLETERQQSYSQRVGELFRRGASRFSDDTINLAVSHLYITGGQESGSERSIQLGGSFAVEAAMLPDAQYIALGHLHKNQVVPGSKKRMRYCGSPLQYSRNEISNSNCVYIVEVKPGKEPEIEQVLLKNHKPIEVWKCNGVQEALDKCRENSGRKVWAYLDVYTDRGLTQDEIKEMKELVTDIVQIRPIFPDEKASEEEAWEDLKQLKMDELFKAYYISERGAEVPEELMNIFYEITGGDTDETQTSQN